MSMVETLEGDDDFEVTNGKWETKIRYADGSISRTPTKRKQALDLSLKIAGAFAFYWIGRGVGEGLDNLPYVNEWIPNFVNYHIPGIDITDKLDRIVGILGGVYGFIKTKTDVHKYNPNILESLKVGRMTIYLHGKTVINYRDSEGGSFFRGLDS